jgi:membrane protein
MDEKTERKKLSFKGIWGVLKHTFTAFSDDKVTKLSGSLAYYTVFSMGPLLVLIISLCGLFFKKEAIEGRIYIVLKDFIGQDSAAQLELIIKNASVGDKSTTAAIVGFVILIVGATSVFAEIQDSINMIWGLKAKPKRGWLKFLQIRFLSFSVIIGLGFLLLVSLAITGLIEGISDRLLASFPHVTVIVFYVTNMVLTFGISMLIFAVIFKVLPDAKIKWKDVMSGAFITALLFILGKFAISLYLSKTNVGSTYGAAGSLVVLISWIYYSAMILYLGAEFTKAYALAYGSQIAPNAYAVTIKQVEVETKSETIQESEQVVVVKKE